MQCFISTIFICNAICGGQTPKFERHCNPNSVEKHTIANRICQVAFVLINKCNAITLFFNTCNGVLFFSFFSLVLCYYCARVCPFTCSLKHFLDVLRHLLSVILRYCNVFFTSAQLISSSNNYDKRVMTFAACCSTVTKSYPWLPYILGELCCGIFVMNIGDTKMATIPLSRLFSCFLHTRISI